MGYTVHYLNGRDADMFDWTSSASAANNLSWEFYVFIRFMLMHITAIRAKSHNAKRKKKEERSAHEGNAMQGFFNLIFDSGLQIAR